MNCEKARDEFPLLLYGELSFDQEETLERHLDVCAACRTALECEKALHSALDLSDLTPPAGLLTSSRRQLFSQLAAESKVRTSHGWFGSISQLLSGAWLKPVGAVALLFIGFAGARLTMPGSGGPALGNGSSPQDVVATRVKYLEPGQDGRIRIVLEETRQKRVTGTLGDERVLGLVLAAAQDPADPGLRVDSVELLKGTSEVADVRGALLRALQSDPNPGVRLKALEALKPHSAEDDVRRTLAQVLLNDENPGIRTQAVEMLVAHREKDMVGVLQELMRREENDYIRSRTQRVLREMNASVDTY
jgi:hypothetical protein